MQQYNYAGLTNGSKITLTCDLGGSIPSGPASYGALDNNLISDKINLHVSVINVAIS